MERRQVSFGGRKTRRRTGGGGRGSEEVGSAGVLQCEAEQRSSRPSAREYNQEIGRGARLPPTRARFVR